jgi:hypothetical protein
LVNINNTIFNIQTLITSSAYNLNKFPGRNSPGLTIANLKIDQTMQGIILSGRPNLISTLPPSISSVNDQACGRVQNYLPHAFQTTDPDNKDQQPNP